MRMWAKEFRKDTEDMILCMADIVKENRLLRDEVERLSNKLEEFYKRDSERYEQSQQTFEATVNIALQGIINREPASETVRKMLDTEAGIKGWR